MAVSRFNKDGDDSLILYSSRYSRSCPSCVLRLGSRAAALSSSVDVTSARTRTCTRYELIGILLRFRINSPGQYSSQHRFCINFYCILISRVASAFYFLLCILLGVGFLDPVRLVLTSIRYEYRKHHHDFFAFWSRIGSMFCVHCPGHSHHLGQG